MGFEDQELDFVPKTKVEEGGVKPEMENKDDVNDPLSPLVSSDGQALSPLGGDQLLEVLCAKKKAKKFKKGGSSGNKESFV